MLSIGKPIVGGKPFAALAAAASFVLLAACGGNGDSAEQATSSKQKWTEISSVERAENGALSDMIIGDTSAPVQVIEYASITCPHCATFHYEFFPTLKEEYVDTGKAYFVFREFPTAPANLSIAGSLMARCAADKAGDEAYFAVLDTLFSTQQDWIFADQPRQALLKIAGQAGMNEADFDACMGRNEVLDLLNANIDEARTVYKVQSTPNFVVNGRLHRLTTLDNFRKSVDEAYAAATK